MRTYSKGQTYFFASGYDIVSDKTNLSVDCGATNHVIIDKSKFINFNQNFEPENRKGVTPALIYAIAKDTCGCIFKKMLYIFQLLNKIYFQYKRLQKMVCT